MSDVPIHLSGGVTLSSPPRSLNLSVQGGVGRSRYPSWARAFIAALLCGVPLLGCSDGSGEDETAASVPGTTASSVLPGPAALSAQPGGVELPSAASAKAPRAGAGALDGVGAVDPIGRAPASGGAAALPQVEASGGAGGAPEEEAPDPCTAMDPNAAANGPDCTLFPAEPSCEVDLDFCQLCRTDARCKCILQECITNGIKEGPLACSGDADKMYNGGSTRYWINQASSDRDQSGGYEALGCGNPVVAKGDGGNGDNVLGAPGDGRFFAALNSEDFGEDAVLCGACVRVNDKVTVQIVDECPNRPGQQSNPKCTSGHLDLSVPAANELGGDNPGVSWKVVPCEGTTPQYVWLNDSQRYWGSLVITGLTYPARKVELRSGGQWVEGKRKPFWGPWIFGKDDDIPGSAGSIPGAPWVVRITDMHGQVMVDTFGTGKEGYANPVSDGKVEPYPSEGMLQLPVCGM